MNDNSQDRPLPKATPRNHSRSETLDKITVSLERFNVNAEKKQQVSMSVDQNEKNEVYTKKESMKVKEVEKEQNEDVLKNEQILEQKQYKVKYDQRVSNNKDFTKKIQSEKKQEIKIVSLPDQQGEQELQQNTIQKSGQLQPQIEQVEVPNNKKLLLQMRNQQKHNKQENYEESINNAYSEDASFEDQQVFKEDADQQNSNNNKQETQGKQEPIEEPRKIENNKSKQLEFNQNNPQINDVSTQQNLQHKNNYNTKQKYQPKQKPNTLTPQIIQQPIIMKSRKQSQIAIQSLKQSQQKIEQKAQINDLPDLKIQINKTNGNNTISQPQPQFPHHKLISTKNQNQNYPNQQRQINNIQLNEKEINANHHPQKQQQDYSQKQPKSKKQLLQRNQQQCKAQQSQLQQRHYQYNQERLQQQQEDIPPPPPAFDIESYKRVQPLLQELLSLLKNSLKIVKQQAIKARVPSSGQNIANNNFNNQEVNLMKNGTNMNQNGRFFKQSRSQSRNKSNKVNSSLMDIMQRRRLGKVNGEQEYENRGNVTQYNNLQYNNQSNNYKVNSSFDNNNVSMNMGRQHKVNMFGGGRNKQVLMGLGNLGNNNVGGGNMTEYGFKKNNQQNQHNQQLQQSRYEQQLNQLSEQQQKQNIIQNRNKINQILAATSMANFNNNMTNNHINKQKKYHNLQSKHQNQYNYQQNQYQQQNQQNNQQVPLRQKISSFFSQQQKKLPQGIQVNNNNISKKSNNNHESSFYNQSQTSKSTNIFHSRKIIKSSNNFNKLNKITSQSPQLPQQNNHTNSTTTQLPSSKATIERRQQFEQSNNNKRASSFFQPNKIASDNKPQLMTLTPILKVIKRYLQIIAEGRIDDIQYIVANDLDGGVLQMMTTSLNDLIGRKKLFKMAMYFQRAAVVAGICYGYLIITEEKGILRFQAQQLHSRFFNNHQQNNTHSNTLKQQTKLILKYMINLISFCLNNTKLIIKTIETYYLLKSQQKTTQRSQKNQSENINNNTKRPKQSPQQQLIERQIYKRNIETIKLNVQYVQQTLQKLFAQTYQLAKNYDIDEDFGESFKNVTKIVNKNSIQQSFYTLLEYFSFYLSLAKRQRSIPFLAVAPNPYLDPTQRYTLVIDFISVFCHGTKRSKTFIFRPYSQHFLYEMSQYFDIVVISDALPQQIDKIIDILDPKNIIQHRLYKYHMVEQRLTGKFIKNLQRIGRDINKTILLDVQDNRVSQDGKNTIFINQWRGSKHDSTLAELCSVLISIVMQNLDCDKAAKIVDRQMKMNRQKGIKFINFGLNLKEQVENQMENSQNQGDDTFMLKQSEI